MNAFFTRIAPAVVTAAFSLVTAVSAADVNMAGWQTWGGITAAANTSTTIAVPAGTTGVSALSFANLNFNAINGSYLSEFVIRVEVPGSATAFWAIKPSTTAAGGNFTGSGTGTTFAGAPFTIPAGTTSLRVFVYESYNDGGDTTQDAQVNAGTLTVTFGNPPPPFDPCAAPVAGVIGANTVPMSGTSPNLPLACGTFAADANKASYVRFVAPTTGSFSANTCTGTLDTVMSVLTVCGDASTALTCNDDLCGLASSVTFSANAGDVRYIAVGLYSTTAAPPATITVTIAEAAPPFDACAAPLVAQLGSNSLPMNPGAADLDIYWANVVVYKCNYLKFTPTQTGIYTFSNCADSSFDSWIIMAYACNDADSVQIGNDDGCGVFAGPSSFYFTGEAGVTYYIGIGAYGPTDPIPTTTTVEITAQYCTSGFDACANQTVVTVGQSTINVDCGAATLDLTGYWTPAFGDAAVGTANYLRFVAPTTAQYEVGMCQNDTDSRLAVLGTCGDATTFIAADDDGCTGGAPPYTSKVSWAATAGTTYYIAVGCYIQQGAIFPIPAEQIVDVGVVAPPANPCDPNNVVTVVAGGSYQVIPDSSYPTLDMAGSACTFPFAPQTITSPKYLKIVPTVSGSFTVANCADTGTTVDCRIACMTACGNAGSTLACDDDGCTAGAAPFTSSLTVDLVAGTTYYFAVGGYSAAASGPFNITVVGPAGPPPCPADLNLDHVVSGADLGLLLGNWGFSGTGDLNGDGVVTGADLGLLLGAWGACP